MPKFKKKTDKLEHRDALPRKRPGRPSKLISDKKIAVTATKRRRGRPPKSKKQSKPSTSTTGENENSCENSKQLFGRDEDVVCKETEFDKLISPEFVSNFASKPIKTYGNKKKLQPQQKLLEFEDCKNRDNIIEWLNDNRNHFDRLTQTQRDSSMLGTQTETLDMPSVSQMDTSDSESNKQVTRRKVYKTAYNLRARSVEVSVKKKNWHLGRIKSYSLLGDTPMIENYNIEDDETVKDRPNSAEDEERAKLFIDLVEDEYLKSIEQEFQQNVIDDDKKNDSGWDRMKKIKRQIPVKKRPKKLNISVTQSQNQNQSLSAKEKDDSFEGQKLPTYDLDVMETYFCNQMSVLLNGHNNLPVLKESPPKNLKRVSNEFVEMLKTLNGSKIEDLKNYLLPLFNELRFLFGNCSKDKEFCCSETQTDTKNFADETSQTVQQLYNKISQQTQTFQTKLQTTEMQTVQQETCKLVDKGVQTENNSTELLRVQSRISGSATPDIFQCVKNSPDYKSNQDFQFDNFFDGIRFETEPFNVEDNNNNSTKINTTVVQNSFTIGSGIDMPEIENAVKDSSSVVPKAETTETVTKDLGGCVGEGKAENSVKDSSGSVLVCTVGSSGDKLSVKVGKRSREQSPGSEEVVKPKRPCNKFLNNDLSVAFETCTERFDDGKVQENEDEDDKFSEDFKFTESLVAIMKKYENRDPDPTPPKPNPQPRSTQEEIEYCEDLLYNATRPKPAPLSTIQDDRRSNGENDKSGSKSDKSISDEIFISNNMFFDTANLTKIERDIDYFRADVSSKSETSAGESADDKSLVAEKAEICTPPKRINSRRSLFGDKSDSRRGTFSESLFADGEDGGNKMIMNKPKENSSMNNLETLRNEIRNDKNEGFALLETPQETDDKAADEEVQEIISRNSGKRITVLQNILVKGPSKSDDDSDDCFSDVDIVESTPQKKLPNFLSNRPENDFLDITLPPPPEFQDMSSLHDDDITFIDSEKSNKSPERRPLADLVQNKPNKITSTPLSLKQQSERFPSLSPISPDPQPPLKMPKLSPQPLTKPPKPRSGEKGRTLGPIELAQQTKFSPLTIVKRQTPQRSFLKPLPSQRKQKSILNYVNKSQSSQSTSQHCVGNDNNKSRPCIACTRITKEEVFSVNMLCHKKLATFSSVFSTKVTHLVVSVNEKNCIKDHTMKFVSAVAAGIWVVSFRWIQECLAQKRIVPEESFEALDVSGIAGPRMSRMNRSSKGLFSGYKIFPSGPFMSTTQKGVENVIKMLGGAIVSTPEELYDKNGYHCLVVTEAKATQDFDLYESWMEVLKVVTVDIEWLSRSVGQYQLLSLRPFALCSEDSIDHLGYPPELLIKTPFSFSQNTYSSVSNQ